ncbi:probable methyltransferase PMT3 [Olea europaea subsp. europaea]|uniref:Methyltransferase n=1 Tax=Olea europaea subsp. europaea TaxID=158383 RepID=A0A8S0UGQ7_OLEEU|nr:probable methyltransferase PMT3 [Olea europaea subsp. europaea]
MKFGLDDGEDVIYPKSFPVCDDRHSEIIPCLDRNLLYQMRLKSDLNLMEHYEDTALYLKGVHACSSFSGLQIPIKWPKSRDEVWKANIPHTHLAREKSDQNWMVEKGDKIQFPGGGTHFHYGVDKYIASIANVNFLAHKVLFNEPMIYRFNLLWKKEFLLILVFLGQSKSSELAHCSRCRTDWLQRDGLILLELDRLLRPGGYFAYSFPEAYAQDEEDRRIWREISELVEHMCWRIAAMDQTVIWQKPLTNDHYLEKEPGTRPPLCQSDDDPDATWGMLMEPCITPYSDHKGSGLEPWPARPTFPPRLADFGYSNEMFEKDINKDMCVMNVVPEDGPKTTVIVCESFSTYPRTYDLLHAWTVFSDVEKKVFLDVEKKGCSGEDLLIEMDRILRPTSFIIIWDKLPIIKFVKKYLTALRWEAVATSDCTSDLGQDGDEVVFINQKKLWFTSESFRDTE